MIVFTLLLLTISEIHASVKLHGDQYIFSHGVEYTKLSNTVTENRHTSGYHYNKFYITRDLGYTSWDKFLEDYKYADFDEKLRIEFSRHDKLGKTFDVRVSPNKIDLDKVTLSKRGSMLEGYGVLFPTYSEKTMVFLPENHPFRNYDQKIFDEMIQFGSAELHGELHVSLEGYTRNDKLILSAIYIFECFYNGSSSGMDFKMTGHNAMIFKP